MSYNVIHILLLNGRLLCVELKNLRTKVLLKHLSFYLSIKSKDNFGLLYRDSRGIDQWLEESKLISDHDLTPCDQILQLVLKIRFIPHYICQEVSNIHHLILTASRLLRQNWLLSQSEIHSQLAALLILSFHGSSLSDTDVYSSLIRFNVSTLDPFTKDNHFDAIVSAYKIYRGKFHCAAEFALKFLQLMMQFPLFNSRLFVVSNSGGEKFVMGISSCHITVFYLHKFHEPIKKISFKYVDNVMHRDIKIIIILRRKERNQRSVLRNEMVTYFALSAHQSDCIFSEIETCWSKYKESTPPFTISDLMKDVTFNEQLSNWLRMGNQDPEYPDYHSDYIDMHVVSTGTTDLIDNEQDFGEMSMYDCDIYHKLALGPSNLGQPPQKPTPDFEQLSSESATLRTILFEKMNELLENCYLEKDITGAMPIEHKAYFPSGNSMFVRTGTSLNPGRLSHRSYVPEMKSRLVSGGTFARPRHLSRDDHSYHSSKLAKGSMSPSVSASRMKTSQSVADLRLSNKSSNAESPLISRDSRRNTSSNASQNRNASPRIKKSLNDRCYIYP